MSQAYEEKRSFPRTFFDSLEKVAATINGTKDFFSVAILDLSVGGLQFSQEREGAVVVKPGDQLSLVEVQGVAGLQIVRDVTIEVRWVIDHSFLGVISAGCHFIDLPEEYQQQIEQVVDARCQK